MFLYFLPGHQGNADQALPQFGLEHIKDPEDTLHSREVVRGIDGQHGMIVGNARSWDASDVSFSDKIQWKPFPKNHAEKQAYCGWIDLPTPQSLERREMLDGHYLNIDGQQWLIPVARDAEGLPTLPMDYDLNEETGELEATAIKRKYKPLWQHCLTHSQLLVQAATEAKDKKQSNFTFDMPNPEQVLCDAFTANYRVHLRELTILQTLGTESLQKVMDLLLDVPGSGELKKTLAPDDGSTSAGDTKSSTDSLAITAQA